jgi:hypothetical protein
LGKGKAVIPPPEFKVRLFVFIRGNKRFRRGDKGYGILELSLLHFIPYIMAQGKEKVKRRQPPNLRGVVNYAWRCI